MAAGTLVELDTSSGAIDTSDQLNMFEAYQKVFIVNGANLKVADFINTKITCTALTDNRCPAKGDILTQDQGSSKYAYMVVDFVNTARTNIYGYAYYAGGATAFLTTSDISSNDAKGDMHPNPIPHANISAITAKPHWYDWTVYPDVTVDSVVTSYGTMPNKAYLGCLYRGRCVISGNPEAPFQWYMPRQANPFDFAYVANDAQSPVKGGSSDAGELGDIVRALIPYKDDYLIFGCATSMWYLAGDPAEGGSINELDLTVGIFGANSWCFDGTGTLYFWGTNGIYSTTIPGTPRCVSQFSLPGLVGDEKADPSTHRITMAYDRSRSGLLISITLLADGTNSNYFYDLRTIDEGGVAGFFPESYPEECGPYSLFYYAANSTTYRDLLVGCKDGYIRKFSDSAKDDDIGATDEAISSHVVFGPIPTGSNPFKKGKLTKLECVTAGGRSSGSQSDTDAASYKVFADDSAEGVLEKVYADTPSIAGALRVPGRQRGGSIRKKVQAAFLGIKLFNSTKTKTWGFEQLLINLKDSGRIK